MERPRVQSGATKDQEKKHRCVCSKEGLLSGWRRKAKCPAWLWERLRLAQPEGDRTLQGTGWEHQVGGRCCGC